jgi:hypothetical protein
MRTSLTVGLLWAAIWQASSASPAAVVIEVAACRHDRQNTIISFVLPEQLHSRGKLSLTRLDNQEPIDVQVDNVRAVWIMRELLRAGRTRRYRIAPAKAVPLKTAVAAENDGRHLVVRVGSATVLQYNAAVVPSSIPGKPEYQRSGYIHPIYDTEGRSITDDMAPDHAHQHGVMFPYQNVTFEGRRLNFWEPSNGTVSHARTRSIISGPVFGGFGVDLQHDENDPSGSRPVLDETWDVAVYNRNDAFLFDIVSVQSCATGQAVTVEKNSYGGLAIRGHRNWFDHPEESEYLTSEGNTRANGNQTRPRWVDLHGMIQGHTSGVAILDHPANFRFPQPVRLHPEKPYFCFAPMALDSFRIEPGKPLVSRYRYFVHVGKPDATAINAVWDDFAEAPEVTVVR